MRYVTKTITQTVRASIRGVAESRWRVPDLVTHLVIPASDSGKWIGPPVAVFATGQPETARTAVDAAEKAAERTLRGEPYGFVDGVPNKVYVVPLDSRGVVERDSLIGRYVVLHVEEEAGVWS